MSSPAAQLPSPAAPVARRGSRERTLPLTALLAGFIVLQSALTGFSTQVDVPGGLSVQGLLTLSYAGISVLVLLASPTLPRPAFKAFWPVMLFLGFSLLALGWYTLTIVGVQNLSAFASFVGVFVLCATWARDDERFGGMLMKVFWWAVAIASFQYLVVAALYGPGQTENPIMPARPFAMFALIGLAAVLAGWRYGNRAGLFLGLLVVATIGISLSRTSLIVSVVLLALMWIPARGVKGWLRLAALAALAVFSLNWAIYNIPALHDRFFEGDVTLGAGGVAVNASGRTLVWQIVVDSWRDSPWIGKGPGSANPPLEARLPGRGINGHP
ncbi:MAG TPA: O-antigen ligase family protein, partial [Deinococcales bacterium]|nr:O-antigen ligase family protein [Deinococcales bacterium]